MKKQKEKIIKTKIQSARQIICIIALAIVGLFFGYYIGNMYILSKSPKTDYGKYTKDALAALSDDVDSIVMKSKDNTPDKLSASECFVVAEHNLKNSEMYSITESGSLKHVANQNLSAYRYLHNGITYFEEISYGNIKSVAMKFVASNGELKAYKGSAKKNGTADWSTKYTTFSYDEFEKMVGVTPNNAIPFFVSSKTVVESNLVSVDKNGNTKFSMQLTTDSAVANYAKKIRYTSDLAEYPTFLTFGVDFIVDANYNFISIEVIEKYIVYYPVVGKVTCNSKRIQTFDFVNVPQYH